MNIDSSDSTNLPPEQIITCTRQDVASSSNDKTYERVDPPSTLCCDPNGLCLGSEGDIDTTKTGFYMGIMKLASQLDGFSSKSLTSPSSTSSSRSSMVVSLDTVNATTLVKGFDEFLVVVKMDNNRKNNKLEPSTESSEEPPLNGTDFAPKI